jgi:hypothetical protein
MISYVPLRKKAGGLSNQNILWLFERYMEELPDYSVILVVDKLLEHLKINNTSYKGILLDDEDHRPSSMDHILR